MEWNHFTEHSFRDLVTALFSYFPASLKRDMSKAEEREREKGGGRERTDKKYGKSGKGERQGNLSGIGDRESELKRSSL